MSTSPSSRRRPRHTRRLKNVKLVQSLWMGVEKLLADPDCRRACARAPDRSRHGGGDVGIGRRARARLAPASLPLPRAAGRASMAPAQAVPRLRPYGRHPRAWRARLGAARKLLALGFNVAGYSRRPKELAGVRSFTELAPMLRITDALVCLLPLTPETRNILNGRNLSLLRKHGCVINLARGGHLVVSDLLRELDSGHLAHAYLMCSTRAAAANDPLWRHPGVTITPHSAALTERAPRFRRSSRTSSACAARDAAVPRRLCRRLLIPIQGRNSAAYVAVAKQPE